MARVIIKKGEEKKLLNLYPWAYREDIESVEGEPHAGEVVELHSARGEFIARAFFNSASHIPIRIVSYDAQEKINLEKLRYYSLTLRVNLASYILAVTT